MPLVIVDDQASIDIRNVSSDFPYWLLTVMSLMTINHNACPDHSKYPDFTLNASTDY